MEKEWTENVFVRPSLPSARPRPRAPSSVHLSTIQWYMSILFILPIPTPSLFNGMGGQHALARVLFRPAPTSFSLVMASESVCSTSYAPPLM